ncbi:MAG: phage holin family protein [Proteobacteria bacterium]|nr:phage holin family protein [Pseudomonadota bacterium]MBU1611397.1 phage holin family protein [Pseudomonadota bacterium]
MLLQEAKNLWDQFEASGFFGWLLGSILWFLGGWDEMLVALMVLVALDFILGTARAVKEGRYNGDVFRSRLLWKIFPALLTIGAAHMLDVALCGRIPFMQQPTRSLVVALVGVTEFLSVNRNLNAVFGVRFIPASLIEKLEAYKNNPCQDGEA